jgi:hypothetical protein
MKSTEAPTFAFLPEKLLSVIPLLLVASIL